MSAAHRGLAALLLLGVLGKEAPAQSWRLRLDAAGQRVAFRGASADSVPQGEVVVGPTGGFISGDGFAVRCGDELFCHFWRPGVVRRGMPAVFSTDLTMWGLGVTGLRVRVHARLNTDLTGDRLWPGTQPALQVAEGFVEYLRNGLTLQGGRIPDQGRLGNSGLGAVDGARASLRLNRLPLDVALYAGWGLARGTILPVTSPAVNPLFDWAPAARQIVAGGAVGARLPQLDAQIEYRREIDPITNYLVAERAGVSAQLRPARRLSVTLGADYDVAQGLLGTAEATAAYTRPGLWLTVGARHYRPFFDLWTVWGAFSPVPYRGVNGSLAVAVRPTVQLRARGEVFRYDASGASTPTVTVKESGWRTGLEATVTPRPAWTVQLGGHLEELPGASSRGVDGRVTWRPSAPLSLSVEGGSLERPLELRFQDGGLTWLGTSAMMRVAERWHVGATVDRYWESRDRPDPAAFDWNQWRVGLRASITLRSEADRWVLPPARPNGARP
jgi:hypothetical protein